ncbi:HEPN domain-containing protein [Shewanella sp. 1CM18E]|uniref:HEPN domain-containing protein n=1 Tax=Shewanella sp. 1CM18E TaxID=2929169 RepID=UPI0020C0499E|nr:HEPN domain-containing protein [Shewanella sp. 1CM18E]MCK8045344.1 HEPN domain-containing protein [Shewanella sp. 1CM18E]
MSIYDQLKARHRQERDSYPQNLSVRVHRALSWLNKAEQCTDDDSRFTFLWVAFNAAYAQDFEQKQQFGERFRYQKFLSKLVKIDSNNLLSQIVWDNYSGDIRAILSNEFILQQYWDFHSGRITEGQWKESLAFAKSLSNRALGNSNTAEVLAILFSRLYTLRNQIIHGGATFDSSANRKQLRDCTNILEKIIPVIIRLMMDGQNQIWGEPVYPLINS